MLKTIENKRGPGNTDIFVESLNAKLNINNEKEVPQVNINTKYLSIPQ